MAKKEPRIDTKAPKQPVPKISSLQISEPAPIVDPPPATPPVNNDKMAEIIEGYEDGMMFVCTKETFDECMSLRLLGLPFAQMKVVKALQAEKSALFLFNMSDRRLHGLFHASSAGGANINRDAWNKGSSNSSPFPAQIEFVIARDCEPIHEKEFKHVFPDKHRIRKLDKVEVQKLVRLFLRDTKSASVPATKRPMTQVSSDKTIPKPAISSIPVKNTKVDGTKPAVVAEKKTEPVAKAQPAFQWAAAPPKFAWGSKKPEKEEPAPSAVAEPAAVSVATAAIATPVVDKPAPATVVVPESPVETVSDAAHSEIKSAATKPNWNEDDLWGPSESETKVQPAQQSAQPSVKTLIAPQPQKLGSQQQSQTQPAQPVQSPQLTPQSQPQQSQLPQQPQLQSQLPQSLPLQQPISQQPFVQQQVNQSKVQPQPIAQHIQPQSAFAPQMHHQPQQNPFAPLQSNGFQSHHTLGAQLPKMHHQSSLFPSALFPPPPPQNHGSQQPLQMHFDDSHWTQDTWKDESVWGSTSANEGWTSWGRSFDSNLLFGSSAANHVMDYAGDDLTSFEQEPVEYEEELPHGPKCACSGCMPNLPPNLGLLLEFVGLSDCYPNFAAEQMDIEALSMCDDTHLHEMNFVVGARVKLGALIRQLQKRIDLGGHAA